VLVTDQRDAEVNTLMTHAQAVGVSELAAPRKIVKVAEVPVLGSGKTDYVAIQRMVEMEARAA
jgi:acyl-[acyl-carrier-protein]-phospholipid O-acyltransferase / long-chain-fatty-acid--[acyl-carrier-protein] ligase